MNSAWHQRGFSLIELAVALFVIALLLGSVLVPLATQVEQRQINETQRSMDEIREALLGFAAANGYLPCPAISATDGQEDRTAGVCTGGKRQGYLPWEALGASKIDAWGRLYRYSVTLSITTAASFTLSTTPDMRIRTRNAAGALANLTNANIVAAVVISHGRNGYGAVDTNGTAVALPSSWPAANTDENANLTSATAFVSRVQQAAGASGTGGAFDDQLVWLSRYTLTNRLVTAGKLP